MNLGVVGTVQPVLEDKVDVAALGLYIAVMDMVAFRAALRQGNLKPHPSINNYDELKLMFFFLHFLLFRSTECNLLLILFVIVPDGFE